MPIEQIVGALHSSLRTTKFQLVLSYYRDTMRALAPLVDKDGFNSDGEKEIVLAVMGVTGAGKSYFIKQLTGQDVELGHGLEAC